MKGQRGFLKVGAAVALLVTGACTPHKLDDGYRQARIDTYDPMSVFAVAPGAPASAAAAASAAR